MVGAFESAFANAPIGMALVDVNGQVQRANDALCRILGYSAQELSARLLCDLADPRDAGIGVSQHQDLLDGRVPSYAVEKRYTHARGHAVWVQLSVSLIRSDEQGERFIAQIQDISDRKELEARLAHLLDHDYLTGLYNGRHFEQALADETRSARRYGGGGAVLLIDLDHFKTVNDRFGHSAGDDLLKTVAAALRGRIRETDTLARLGGDEFGIILPRVDARQAEIVAGEIVKALRLQTAIQAEQRIPITASVGVALFSDLRTGEVMRAADLAMYEAKEAGRDRYAVYRSRTGAVPRRSSRLMEAEWIQRALANDQLELHGQPILALATSDISHYELLLRLRTDERTLLPPSAFLYVAERFGTVVDIDCWVVAQAVQLLARHLEQGRTVTLHVNLSSKSLADSRLVPAVERTIANARVDPSCLVFELTEAATVVNIDRATAFMTALRGLGCGFALDDFGANFGSFAHLKHLPFEYFKIDGDFVRGFSAATADRLVVEALVGIAKGLGKKTVAEFVRDQEMTDRLRDCGVDYAQGFHIGAPRPIADMLALR